MVWLVNSLFLILSSQAQQIEWVKHSQFGPEQIVIKYEAGRTILYTNTNGLSQDLPARVGFFRRAADTKQLASMKKLLGSKANFQALKNVELTPHTPRLFFDGKAVPFMSPAYRQLSKMIQSEVRRPSWALIDGQQLGFTSLKDIEIKDFKAGKFFTSRNREPASVCQRRGTELACNFPFGILYPPVEFKMKPKE